MIEPTYPKPEASNNYLPLQFGEMLRKNLILFCIAESALWQNIFYSTFANQQCVSVYSKI